MKVNNLLFILFLKIDILFGLEKLRLVLEAFYYVLARDKANYILLTVVYVLSFYQSAAANTDLLRLMRDLH